MENKVKRKMPKSYLTDIEREKILLNFNNKLECLYLKEAEFARLADDENTAWEWLALVKQPIQNLRAMKLWYGKDFIIEKGFDTSEADNILGKDWLYKDE